MKTDSPRQREHKPRIRLSVKFVTGAFLLASAPNGHAARDDLGLPFSPGPPARSTHRQAPRPEPLVDGDSINFDRYKGTKIVYVHLNSGSSDIQVMNPDGTGKTTLAKHVGNDHYPDWSPDAKKIAFVSQRFERGNEDIYVMDADGTNIVRVTSNPKGDTDPAWSPDGTKIYFRSIRDGNSEIYVINADGTGEVRLTNHEGFDSAPSPSPDGTRIAYGSQRQGNFEICVMNTDGSQIRNITNSTAKEVYPTWSPDGNWIAFQSATDKEKPNQFDLYVVKPDGTELRKVVGGPSRDEGPAWSPDSKFLVYMSYHGEPKVYEIYVTSLDGKQNTKLSKIRTRFKGDLRPSWSRVRVKQ